MKLLFEHWKTTAAAVALFAFTAVFVMGRISNEAYVAGVATITGMWLMASGDAR